MSEKAGLTAKKSESKGKDRSPAKQKADSVKSFQSMESPVEQILYLQQTIGNLAVTRLIESGALQGKLRIGRPNDIYEQEADRMADQVTGMSQESLVSSHLSLGRKAEEYAQTKPLAEQITPLVQRQAEEEEEVQPKLQRQESEEAEEEETAQAKAVPGNTPEVTPEIEAGIKGLKGGGQPLSESSRAYFEPRFGADFSQVRVHTDSRAAQTAQSINARAFTSGKDIVFNTGQYSPETTSGKHLLSHELTHVVQQVNRKAIYNRDKESFPFSHHSKDVELSRKRFTGGMKNRLFKILKNMDLTFPTIQRNYTHRPGGPYHPPGGVELRCTNMDSCSSLSNKIRWLKHVIKRHREWDRSHPNPRYPGGRHAEEIRHLENAVRRCIRIHQRKCTQERRFQEIRVPSFNEVVRALIILGLSVALAASIIAAILNPEPVTKLALLGLTVVQISLLMRMLGVRPTTGSQGPVV